MQKMQMLCQQTYKGLSRLLFDYTYILHFFYTSYSDKPPHTSCSVQRCDNKELVKEQMKYVMVPVQSEGICCPEYNRVACKDGDSVYQVSNLCKIQ